MKNLFLLSVLTAFTCFSQHAEGKQGKWIYYGKERPEMGIPPQGNPEAGFYGDNRKEITDTTFYRNGSIHRVFYRLNGQLSGGYSIYHPNGQLKESGTYYKNQFSDSLKHYHENGKLEYEAWYNEIGKEHGNVKYYFPNGQLEFTYLANNGTPSGTAYRYYENGDLREIIEYAEDGSVRKSDHFESKNPLPEQPILISESPPAPYPDEGKVTCARSWNPNGYNKLYNEDKKIWQDGTFKNGALWDGKVYTYGDDHNILKIKIYRNGIYLKDAEL